MALRSRSLVSAARNLIRDRGRQATQTDEMHLDPLENEMAPEIMPCCLCVHNVACSRTSQTLGRRRGPAATSTT